jgi:signal transduction histidine kinase
MATAARSIPGDVRAARRMREAERRRLSQALHDETGPLLCAAGMAAELLRGTLEAATPQQEELFAKLSRALEQAVSAVRRLSQEAAPGLASRRGLEGALRLLAEAYGAGLQIAGLPQTLAPARADALCEAVRDILLALEDSSARITVLPRGVLIEARQPIDAETESLLRSAAGEAGLTFTQQRGKETARMEILLQENG